jgi:hypothetical protein
LRFQIGHCNLPAPVWYEHKPQEVEIRKKSQNKKQKTVIHVEMGNTQSISKQPKFCESKHTVNMIKQSAESATTW